MPKAYSYVRFSRPEQARGDSLRRQIEAARRYANERGLDLDDKMRDLGVQAFRGQNRTEGALRKFLDLVKDRKIETGSYLIIESLDRLSREAVIEALPRFLDLINAGIVVVTLDDNQEYSRERVGNDWTSLIVSLAQMARAHNESLAKSQRLGAVWRQKKQHDAREEGKPITRRLPAWLRVSRDGSEIYVAPEAARTIERIFTDYIAGVGADAMARRFNEEEVPTIGHADGWHKSYIQKILKNRAVIGEYQPHTRAENGKRIAEGEPIRNYYPPVIGSHIFRRAQEVGAARRTNHSGRRGHNFPNLFQGLAYCQFCGGKMNFFNKGGGETYLACGVARRRAPGCDHDISYRCRKVEKRVLHFLADSQLLQDYIDERQADAPTKSAELNKLADLEDRKDTIQKTRKRNFAKLRKNPGDADLQEFIDGLDTDLAALQLDIDAAKAAATGAATEEELNAWKSDLLALAKTIYEHGDEPDYYRERARLNQFLRQIFERITLGPNEYVFVRADETEAMPPVTDIERLENY